MSQGIGSPSTCRNLFNARIRAMALQSVAQARASSISRSRAGAGLPRVRSVALFPQHPARSRARSACPHLSLFCTVPHCWRVAHELELTGSRELWVARELLRTHTGQQQNLHFYHRTMSGPPERVFKTLRLRACSEWAPETRTNIFHIFRTKKLHLMFLHLPPRTLHTLHPITNFYIYSI